MSEKQPKTSIDNEPLSQTDLPKKRFISMFSDYGFKVTFGNEVDTTFLKTALPALIAQDVLIKEIRFDPTEVKGATTNSRGGFLDISFTDQNGNMCIIEMQVEQPLFFMQRLKFYTYYKFNIVVKKGDFNFKNLPKIYAIVIFKEIVYYDLKGYHHICCMRNQNGEIIDDQMTFIVVELAKFNKTEEELVTNLDKLLYFMKYVDSVFVGEGIQFPKFFTEDWLSAAIKELDTRQMSPEKRFLYEKSLADAAIIERQRKEEIDAVRKEEQKLAAKKIEEEQKLAAKKIEEEQKLAAKKIEEEQKLAAKKIEEEQKLAAKKIEEERLKAQTEKDKAILQLLLLKVLTPEKIAEIQNVSLERVMELEKQLNKEQNPNIDNSED